jgi:hypothetical protein
MVIPNISQHMESHKHVPNHQSGCHKGLVKLDDKNDRTHGQCEGLGITMEKLGENRGFNQLGKQKQITSQPSLLWITQYDSSVVSLPTKGYANVCYVS